MISLIPLFVGYANEQYFPFPAFTDTQCCHPLHLLYCYGEMWLKLSPCTAVFPVAGAIAEF